MENLKLIDYFTEQIVETEAEFSPDFIIYEDEVYQYECDGFYRFAGSSLVWKP